MDRTPAPRLRHAIVGVGASILVAHRPALSLDSVELVACSDINTALGEPRAGELGCAFYADHRAMLAATQPDVTVILTPHPYHAAIAMDALAAGSHVLVEKPMAVHAGEADAMIEAADTHGRLLAVNFQQRFRPEIQEAYRIIHSGELGELQRVELTEPWMRPAAYYRSAGWRGTWDGEGGGVLMNQAPHGLDLLCHLAGMPSRVYAWTRTLRHAIETEDTALAMVEWENGALGTIFFSTAEAGPRRLEIVGTGGRLEIGGGALVHQRFQPDMRDHIANDPGMYSSPALVPVEVTLGSGEGDHVAVYRNLHHAIRHGTPVQADGRSAALSLELANGIVLSSHAGGSVDFPLDRQAYASLLADLRRQARLRKETS